MTETMSQARYACTEEAELKAVRDFLCGYQLCLDMLNLRRYERKRAYIFRDPCDCEDILSGNEAYWHSRMYEVESLINSMHNGREKLVLYYHYVRGESIERASDLIGFSRRTGYRLHRKALLTASSLFKKMKKSGDFPLLLE